MTAIFNTGIAFHAVLIGVGATIILDLWGILLERIAGMPRPDWGMVGRWIGHIPKGKLVHDRIADAHHIPEERVIGWSVHYLIGILYSSIVVAIWGLDWVTDPTLMPPLLISWVALIAPFFIMQPGMGAGIAASKTPHPNKARLNSIVAHTVFGLGLFVSALVTG